MTKRRRASILILCTFALLTGATLFLTARREPVCRGKKLSEWLASPAWYGDTASDGEVLEAEAAIRQIGAASIPTLLGILHSPEPIPDPLEVSTLDVLAPSVTQVTKRLLRNKAYPMDAIRGFHILGTNAQSAIPALYKMAAQNKSRFHADMGAWALVEIGEPAVPALLSLATNKHLVGRNAATRGLPSKDPRTWPVILSLIDDPDPEIAHAVPFLLYHGRVPFSLTLPALEKGLQSTNPVTRAVAAKGLSLLAPEASCALPQLVALLTDPDAEVREQVTNALRAIAASATNVTAEDPLLLRWHSH